MPKQLFLARFELVMTCFGHLEILRCLQNWPFWDQKGVKNESKNMLSQKLYRSTWGAQTSEMSPFQAHYAPFWPLQSHKMR